MTGGIRTAYQASPGGRSYQEDYCQFSQADGGNSSDGELLAVLADGMGGQGASGSGATASETACGSFIKSYRGGEGTIAERLDAALDESNNSVARKKEEEPELGDMGTTLIGATVRNNGLHWISVGDSHLYLFRHGMLEKLNEDHSFVPMLDKLVERGEISREDALAHPNRNAIRSAVMGSEIELRDLRDTSLPLIRDDIVVLASDGLDTLDRDVIANVIHESSGEGPEAIARDLLGAVEAVGKPDQDNTTVMVISVTEGGGRLSSLSATAIVVLLVLLLAVAGATAWVMGWGFPGQSEETVAPAARSGDKKIKPVKKPPPKAKKRAPSQINSIEKKPTGQTGGKPSGTKSESELLQPKRQQSSSGGVEAAGQTDGGNKSVGRQAPSSGPAIPVLPSKTKPQPGKGKAQ